MARGATTTGSRSPGAASRGAGPAGITALVLVLAVVAGAIALDQTGSPSVPAPSAASTVVDGPRLPGDDALSVAWYCAEGTSTKDGRATETIVIGNLAKHPIDATITVMHDGDKSPPSTDVRIDTLAQQRIAVADIAGAQGEPGVLVEIRGGLAVVEHELRGQGDLAVGPCTREPSRSWYFAEGTTQRGDEEWLAVFNPFGDDAIIDLSFLTDAGFQAPSAFQSMVVPRYSRLSIPIHQQVIRRDRVAVALNARAGRVVAERTVRFDGTDGRKGIAVSLGATGAAMRWRVPYGDARAGVAETVSVANFEAIPSQVSVGVLLDNKAVLAPQTVDVPARSVVRVNVADRVPPGVGYSVDVRVTRRTPVVVEALTSFSAVGGPNGVTGVATSIGSSTTSKRWAFAVGRLDQGETVFSVYNPTDRPVTAQLYSYTAGDPNSPKSAPAEAVPPGERRFFALAELGIPANRVVLVTGDGPIVVTRTILAPAAPAVPASTPTTTPTTATAGSTSTSSTPPPAAGVSLSAGVRG